MIKEDLTNPEPDHLSSMSAALQQENAPALNRELMQAALLAVGVVIDTGKQALRIRDEGLDIFQKEDSRVTNADLHISATHRLLLPNIMPGQVLSEEAVHAFDASAITPGTGWWIEDPIDGTETYISGYPEFTVIQSYIIDGRPVIGVVGAPALDKVYFAVKDQGAYVYDLETQQLKKIESSNYDGGSVRIARPWRMRDSQQEALNKFIAANTDGDVSFQNAAASIKYCLLAEGKVDVASTWTALNAWDIAALDLIVHEAGGRFLNTKTGEKFIYDPANHKVDLDLAIAPGITLTPKAH